MSDNERERAWCWARCAKSAELFAALADVDTPRVEAAGAELAARLDRAIGAAAAAERVAASKSDKTRVELQNEEIARVLAPYRR